MCPQHGLGQISQQCGGAGTPGAGHNDQLPCEPLVSTPQWELVVELRVSELHFIWKQLWWQERWLPQRPSYVPGSTRMNCHQQRLGCLWWGVGNILRRRPVSLVLLLFPINCVVKSLGGLSVAVHETASCLHAIFRVRELSPPLFKFSSLGSDLECSRAVTITACSMCWCQIGQPVSVSWNFIFWLLMSASHIRSWKSSLWGQEQYLRVAVSFRCTPARLPQLQKPEDEEHSRTLTVFIFVPPPGGDKAGLIQRHIFQSDGYGPHVAVEGSSLGEFYHHQVIFQVVRVEFRVGHGQ